MRIPTFFLRTTTRLLIFQTLVAWLCIRCSYLPIPSGIGFALTSTLGTYINTAKVILDTRIGFVLPWEATFFLPAALDAYIIESMPELAILLGTSPCDERIAHQDPETNICVPELAYHCLGYAEMLTRNQPEGSLRIMKVCWENYHTDVGTARQHHGRCHKHESPELMQVIGCMKALEFWEKKWEICFGTVPILNCVAKYGAQDTIAPIWRTSVDKFNKEKAEKETAVQAGEEMTNGGKFETATL